MKRVKAWFSLALVVLLIIGGLFIWIAGIDHVKPIAFALGGLMVWSGFTILDSLDYSSDKRNPS